MAKCHCARVTEAKITAALQVLVAAALGVASGVLGGLFGVGGGVLVIPLLGIVYGVHQQMAQGTALVMVVPNVLFAFWRYRQQFGVDLRMATTIAAAALVTTYPTARLATGLDPDRLRLAFAAFLVGLAAVLAYRTWRGAVRIAARPPLAWGWTAAVGLVGGVVSGFFGVGGAPSGATVALPGKVSGPIHTGIIGESDTSKNLAVMAVS